MELFSPTQKLVRPRTTRLPRGRVSSGRRRRLTLRVDRERGRYRPPTSGARIRSAVASLRVLPERNSTSRARSLRPRPSEMALRRFGITSSRSQM